MLIQPKTRGFICTTAHPTGCAQNVDNQIAFTQKQKKIKGPKNVLIIGASTGYGLASRIVASFGCQANTIGVFFEKPASDKRTASAGWYNTAAFEQACHTQGLYAKSINGDAFSKDIKQQTIDLIQRDWHGQVDLVIYSLASPRRIHPDTGEIFNSTLKPIGQTYENKTVDFMSGEVSTIQLEPASEAEINNTVAVMGGEDWLLWIEELLAAKCLAIGAMTVAYDYIGPKLTYPIYYHGTIGKAKAHLKATAKELDLLLGNIQGRALISVNKCLVTQASAAIPVVPLYTSLLYKMMKAHGTHEGCIEQIYRLFTDRLYGQAQIPVDEQGLIRLDEYEMAPEIQKEIEKRWPQVTTLNVEELTDVKGFRESFLQLFGFAYPEVDYTKEVDPQVEIPSLQKDSAKVAS